MAQPKKVYCVSCGNLLGFFERGVQQAVETYGGSCPQCRNATHHDAEERERQRDAHTKWAKQERKNGGNQVVGHCYSENPDDVDTERQKAVEFVKNHKRA